MRLMKRLFCVCVLGVTSVCFAADTQTITLKDGSKITGEVLSMNGGTYKIQTNSMGVVSVSQQQVVAIQSGAVSGSASSVGSPINASQLQSLQQSIASNPQIMQTITSLQSDPQFQAIMQDPEIMQVIQSGNFGALSQNPKIQQLMNHSAVKNISRQLGQ